MYDKQILEENSVLVVVLWYVYHETTSCSGIESRSGGLCESLYMGNISHLLVPTYPIVH